MLCDPRSRMRGHERYGALLRIPRPFAIAAHNLDFICLHGLTRVLHLESDILDQKGPDFVAETVGVKMALCPVSLATSPPTNPPQNYVP
jgi:hypothetical protein